MTRTPVVIIGAGGFGREVLDVLRSHEGRLVLGSNGEDRFDFLGFLDDDAQPQMHRLERIGATWLGPVSKLEELPKGTLYSIGIASPTVRRRIDEWASRLGYEPVTLIHESATFGEDVRVGPGTVICSHVSVTTNITLGRHVHLNLSTTVGHDAELGDYVTVNPLSAISGDVTLGDEVTIGTVTAVNQGITIGPRSTIGSGASVVKDIPADVVAVGVPAKPR